MKEHTFHRVLPRIASPVDGALRALLWVRLSFRRLTYRPGVTLLDLLGIILAVGLVTSASFFARGVERMILQQELNSFSRVTGRPPFSVQVQASPSSQRPMKLEEAENASSLIGGILASEVGLPIRQITIQVSGGTMMLQALPGSDLYLDGQEYLTTVRAAYAPGIFDHLNLVEGLSFDENVQSGDVLDVWVHDTLAQRLGAHVDDRFQIGITLSSGQIPIRLAGFWKATDPKEEFWYNNPDTALEDALLVRRKDYLRFIQPRVSSGVRQASWYVILDETRINQNNIRSYLKGFHRGQNVIIQRFPDTRLTSSPIEPLENISQRSNLLTLQLLAFNLPALCILLGFLALNSATIARWQRLEMSTMASRGMSTWKILRIPFFEQLLLYLAGAPVGIVVGMLIAVGIGYANGFLSFARRAPLPVAFADLSLPWAGIALGISMLIRLWVALTASRQSFVEEAREWARPLRRPVWHRRYLDFLLLLPAAYVYDQAINKGALANTMMNRPEEYYKDPLLILAPALLIFTASLLAMRLFTVVIHLVDALAGLFPGLSVHLALRNLGRQNQDYINPLLLLIVAFSLGVYTLTTSASLDRWSEEQWYYQAGSDLAFTPQPLTPGQLLVDGSWIPLPSEFHNLQGVAGATRVADLSVGIRLSDQLEIHGRFLGIDRADFPRVAWFRRDFATESLGGLMNRLALNPLGVLVSESFVASHNLRVGDQIRVISSSDLAIQEHSLFTIVGTYRYFPTVYEQQAVTVVGNLEGLSSLMGFTVSHDLWLKLQTGTSGEVVLKQVSTDLRVRPSRPRDVQSDIAQQNTKIERTGTWGTYTIGFLAAVFMAVLGLSVFSYASLRERVYQFSVLRALGMQHGQLVTQVICEYILLAVFGALAGISIGVMAANQIVPSFQILRGPGILVPPLVPVVPVQSLWMVSALLVLVIVAVEVFTILVALRRSLAELIKNP